MLSHDERSGELSKHDEENDMLKVAKLYLMLYGRFRLRATSAPIATIAAKTLQDPGRDRSATIARYGDS
jgi:hypothetical protein